MLKEGLLAYREKVFRTASAAPYDIYKELDLGPGGYVVAPAAETRRGTRAAIARKLGR